MATSTTEALNASNLSCTICSEIYKSNDEVLCTKCGHVFHKKCFEEWHKRSTTCPECRKESPETQQIFLHIEDSTEAEKRIEEKTLGLVNEISQLKRQLEASEQNFFDAQCALTFSDEQVEELKSQLQFINVVNSSYEQEQTEKSAALKVAEHELLLCKQQINELKNQLDYVNTLNTSYDEEQAQIRKSLNDAKLALSLTKEQVDELKRELEYVNVINTNYEQQENQIQETLDATRHALSLSKEQVAKLNQKLELQSVTIVNYEKNFKENQKHVAKENENESSRIDALKLENEKKIADLLQKHAIAEGLSEQVQLTLQTQLKNSKDEVVKLKAEINKLKIESQSQSSDQHLKEKKRENGSEFLEEKIKRLEIKLKNITTELDKEIGSSMKLTVENMKLKRIIKEYNANEQEVFKASLDDNQEIKSISIKSEEPVSHHLLDI